MAHPLRLGRTLLLAVAFGAYLLLAHLTTAPDQPSTLGALVAVVPYMGIALMMAWRSRHRLPALLLWGGLASLLGYHWTVVESRFEWIYFIQHLGVFSLLAIGFGRTLAAGEEPMITRFARVIHGDRLAPPLQRYTHGATLAWAIFFALMASSSATLFFAGSMHAWSLLINLFTPILIGAMFVVEFIVRLIVLPPALRTGLADSVRAFLHASRGATPPAA